MAGHVIRMTLTGSLAGNVSSSAASSSSSCRRFRAARTCAWAWTSAGTGIPGSLAGGVELVSEYRILCSCDLGRKARLAEAPVLQRELRRQHEGGQADDHDEPEGD